MESVAVVAVPFPMQGHLNQLLHLSLQLASRGLDVHYAAPVAHVRQARARVHGWDERALRSIRFHELGIAAFAAPPPDPNAASPFPTHIMPMWVAYIADAAAPLAALLRGLSASRRRVVVVHDVLNAFAAVEAERLPNAESFGLCCGAVSYMVGMMDAGHRLLRDGGLDYVPMEAYVSKEFMDCAKKQASMARALSRGGGMITNTCRALEGEFVDAFGEALAAAGQKLFAVGPLNPLLADATAPSSKPRRHECLDWLDAQPAASVLYVSFGSTSSLRAEQVAELAAALHGSGQRFIWVLRDADRGDVFADDGDAGGRGRHAALVSEFAERTRGTGLVITGWAPQLEILAHPATAAFMSHCGWNSTVESMSHGKPMLAWPMHSDQPWDAQLVGKYLKAGLLVRPWERHGEVTPAAAIQEAIETAMVADEGLAMRRRAEAIGEAVRACAAAGGSSRRDLDDFVAKITR